MAPSSEGTSHLPAPGSKDMFMTASPGLDTHRLPSPDSAGSLDASGLLRSVFRRHAAGVAVITAHGERPVGFTATSLASVSVTPALLSFGIGLAASSWPVIARADHVGVHVLGEHQHELATTFARSGADRFAAPTRWRSGPEGVPVLQDVAAWLVCRVVARVPAGDHRIILAEPLAGESTGTGRPLLYHDGGYRTMSD
jgi:flavin reductase (DIM6/NTAB) family NADH-FMN oxidoreductase RutF